jgi:hypothetical protein
VTRRVFIGTAAIAALARGDAAAEVWELLVKMAAALAEDNVSGFLDAIDPKMPGFDQLSAYVNGMIQQSEVRSIIEKLGDSGDDRARSLQLDWFLQMKRRGAGDRTLERRQIIRCDAALQGKRWRVVRLDPIQFFAPPEFQ